MRLSKKVWLAIVLFSLCGQVAWAVENMLFNVFIQQEFNANLNSIALMVSLSAVVATVTTLFMGALSDRLGKRKIFICLGYIIWGLSIMGFAFLKVEILEHVFGPTVNALALGVSLTILFDCIMTVFGSMANDSSFNAWMTDVTDDSNRGIVEGINSAMPLLAILLVFGGKMLVEGNEHEWTIIFLAIGGLLLVLGILGLFVVEDVPKERNNDPYFKNIFYGFRPSVMKENKHLYLLFLGFMLFSISLQVFMPYLILYYTNNLLLKNYVLLFAPAIVLAAIFTGFYGRWIDRFGFVKMCLISLGIYAVGLFALFFARSSWLVFIATLFMMMGFLSTTACFNASIRSYTPEAKVGLFQGIRLLVGVLIPMLIGPWLGALVSGGGGLFGVTGDGYTPSAYIFLLALGVGVLTYIALWLIHRQKEATSDVEL